MNTNASKQRADEIGEKLLAASALYYNPEAKTYTTLDGGKAKVVNITDAEYDTLEDELRKIDPSHPALTKIGAPTDSGWAKVSHPIPMGSLNKAQDDAEFTGWVHKIRQATNSPFFITEKMDGISILLTYDNGELVRAETRGNGTIGEDITRNVRIMKGVPAKILYQSKCYVRGEIVCRHTDFDAHFQGDSNPRNTASGTAKRQSRWQKAKHLTVYAYNLTAENTAHKAESRNNEFDLLEQWGFLTPGHQQAQEPGDVIALRDIYIQSKRGLLDYDIDGLVIEVDNTRDRHAMGEHNLRPKGAIAFKFPHDAKPTRLKTIQWQVGNSGRVTPVAVFETVELAGANVTNANLHNVSNIERLCSSHRYPKFFRTGDLIMVSRRNDVIPQVEQLIDLNEEGERIMVPSRCPSCDSRLQKEGEYLVCKNEEDCEAQVLGSLKRWIGKLGILHFGSALLRAVVDAKMVSTIGDLYRLKEAEVSKLEMDGRRVGGAAKRALASVEGKRELTLDQFVGSIGIPLVGRRMTKFLMDAGYDTLDKMDTATTSQLAAVPGFGQGRAEAFRVGFDARKGLIVDILAAGVTIVVEAEPEVTGSGMAGEAVCYTGVRDKEAAAEIVAQGGKIASGVSKNTTILVCKDVTSNSGKAKKARELGLQLMTQNDMRARLGLAPV